MVFGASLKSSVLRLNVVRQWPLWATICKTKLMLLCKVILYFSVVVRAEKSDFLFFFFFLRCTVEYK